MVDFGRRPGDMFKDDYDADDSGVVDEVEALPDHADDHEDTGDDEISVDALSGELADVQPPKAHLLGSASHSADSLVNLNLKISDGDLDKTTDTRTPAAHKASHQDGGTDEISVSALSGELADAQPVKAHDLTGGRHNAGTLANFNALISDATLDKDTDTRTPAAHKASHQDGGTDEISVSALSGELADNQPPKAHDLAGAAHNADTLADLNAKVSDATLDDSGDARTPAAHKASHQNGGGDEISVAGLSGELADVQPPKAHLLGSASHSADTLANLNAKVSDGDLDKTTDTRTPAAHKASHQDGGGDEIAATGLVGRINLVDRGDPTEWDWTVGDFTTDATWRDLDCSGKVPVGTQAILFRGLLIATTPGETLALRKNGMTNAINVSKLNTVVNGVIASLDMIVFCDANRFVEYYVDNATWSYVNLQVAGWFI